MAKTDPTTNDVELFAYVPETSAGRYDGHILAMIEGDERLAKEHPDEYKKGARTGVKVVFPGPHREMKQRPAKDGKPGEEYEAIIGEEGKYKRFFQDSAKARGYTASVVKTEDQGDGLVQYEFILKPAQKRTHKHTEQAAADTETVTAA